MSTVRVCQITDVVCSRGCGLDKHCKLDAGAPLPVMPAAQANDPDRWADAAMPPDIERRLAPWLTNGAALHPLTINLVVRFARAMAAKLSDAEAKYGYSDGWMRSDWLDQCRANLLEHVAKGDPRDVAAYCAFLWHHGERTAKPLETAAQAVVDAAREWSAERSVKDWAEADLMKAISTLDGDWPGCEGCDHQCDEPCMPATVAQQHAMVDRQIAQLVYGGKLLAPEGYAPPEGFQPYPPRRKTIPIAHATPDAPPRTVTPIRQPGEPS